MTAVKKPSKKAIFLKSQSERKRKLTVIDPQTSKHGGIKGLYETLFRRFKTIVFILSLLPLYFVGASVIGAALLPGILLVRFTWTWTQDMHWLVQDFSLGLSVAVGYILYGFSLILIIPTTNFVLRTKPKISRGPYYSVDFLKWFVHNALTYVVRYTFLEFITPTPFNLFFFRRMGMKVGRGTQINTSHISDPALIEIGDHVTIGGSATLCAHYGMGGYLILAPVKIGNKVTVGLKASIMGGVEIGEGAKILPHSVVLPKTVIGAHETWGGVPAVKIK
jgi:hypothetical protein